MLNRDLFVPGLPQARRACLSRCRPRSISVVKVDDNIAEPLETDVNY